MEQNNSVEPLEYVYAVWRRKWLFLLVSAIALVGGVFAITQLPVVYRSTGTILIERQDIPEQWVNSTITTFAAERIQSIGQRVLTTGNLSRIVEKYGLFPDKRDYFTMDELAQLAKDNFSIENVRRIGPNSNGTAAFRVSYQDASARTARDVASEIVSMYLGENKKSRTQAATDTRRFLEGEADRLERELATIEEKISKFKEENIGVLPENQSLNIQSYERVEQQIFNIDSTLKTLEDRKFVIESSIASARRMLSTSIGRTGAEVGAVSLQQQLNVLRSQYANLQTRYSSAHPDIKRLSREIQVLETQLGSDQGAGPSIIDDTAIIQLKGELRSTINEHRSLQESRAELETKLNDLEEKIGKTPSVELEYRTLLRDQENTQNKYNDIRSKQNSARVSQSLEEEQKGERFTLIEAPRIASRPHSPNYSKAYAMVIGLAFLSGLGAVFGFEYLDGRVRNARTLEILAGVPVLASVGYIENARDRRRRVHKWGVAIAGFIFLILSVLYVAYQYNNGVELQVPESMLENIPDWLFDFQLPR